MSAAPQDKLPTLAANGDLFEQGYEAWINANLPDYERNWATFIGNNGKSQPDPLVEIAAEAKDDWRKFYQSHYSMAVYAFLLDELTNRAIDQLHADEMAGASNTPAALTQNLGNFTQFVALVGQVCDMVEQVAEAVDNGAIAAEVNEFAKTRSNAIHSACIPMSHDYVGVKIPAIATRRGVVGEWSEDARWDFVDPNKLQYLEDWFRDTRDGLLATLKHPVQAMIRKAAERRFVPRRELERGFKTPDRPSPPVAPPAARDPANPAVWRDFTRSGENRPM
jgi:hypothetical protein